MKHLPFVSHCFNLITGETSGYIVMLLNRYGQPTLLCRDNQHNIDELRESPMLMCHKDAFVGKLLPTDWCGCLYASGSIINEMNNTRFKVPSDAACMKVPLMANESFNITLEGNDLKVTMIDLYDNLMYIIKDKYVCTFLTDNITVNDLYVFQWNKLVREHIAERIDVLYINDAVYKEPPNPCKYPSKFVLKSLTTLVQPKRLKGYFENTLPQSLLDCCEQIYF